MPTPTNSKRQQLLKLVELMKDNDEIARGILHGRESKEKWDEIAETLNKMGPHERKGKQWRKVWDDLKFQQQLRAQQRDAPEMADNNERAIEINLEEVVFHILRMDEETESVIAEAIELENEIAMNEEKHEEIEEEIAADADMPGILPEERPRTRKTLRELTKYIAERAAFHNNLLETMQSIAGSMKNIEIYQRKHYILEKERLLINKRYMKRKQEFKRFKIELKAQTLAYKNNRRLRLRQD